MDIIELGASILSEKLGMDLDPAAIAPALSGLLSNSAGELDLAGLAGKMASSGDLGAIVGSWLGDGANDAISADSIAGLFGSDKLSAFASQLGLNTDQAAGGLAQALPEIMDKSSSGGNLLEMAGGASGLLGAAKSLFS
ncbi:MAG: YidB family protein [Pseudomonadota bacterium]